METSKTATKFLTLDDHNNIVKKSKDLAKIHVRKSMFITEVNLALERYGGMRNWLIAHAIALAGTLIFGAIPFRWSEVVSLFFGVVFSSIVTIHNFTALSCDIYTFINGQSTEDYIYRKLVRTFFNSFGVFVLPLILVVVTIVFSLISMTLAHQFFGVTAVVTLIIFIINQLANSIKNIKDYSRVISAFIGNKTAALKDTDSLTINIYQFVKSKKYTKKQLVNLRQLADIDLRQAEISLEITNLTLAFFAIIISVLLSEQIVQTVGSSFSWLNSLFVQLGGQLSVQFEFGSIISELFSRGLYVALWWQLTNILAGIGFLIIRSLVSVYFFTYRPAYALTRSFILFDLDYQDQPNDKGGVEDGV